MFADPQFWVAIAFVIFIAVIFNPIRKILGSTLDNKINEMGLDGSILADTRSEQRSKPREGFSNTSRGPTYQIKNKKYIYKNTENT